MSTSRTPSGRPLTCTDVRFVVIELPRPIQPRLVIEFSHGLSLLLEDEASVPLAASFVASFRKHLAGKGGRKC